MKKFLSVMLALAMAMSLAACGGSSSSSDNSGSSDSQGGDASGPVPRRSAPIRPKSGKSPVPQKHRGSGFAQSPR